MGSRFHGDVSLCVTERTSIPGNSVAGAAGTFIEKRFFARTGIHFA
jgi:hypothetical protein